MKKRLGILLAVLLAGCIGCTAQEPASVPKQTQSAVAEFCTDSNCEAKKRIKLNEEQIKEVTDYLGSVSQEVCSGGKGDEMARLILSDADGNEQTYIEFKWQSGIGDVYLLEKPGHICMKVGEKTPLWSVLAAFDAEEVAMTSPLVETLFDDYFVISYSDVKMVRADPGGKPYYEPSNIEDKQSLRLLFYVDEEFGKVSEIEDQESLLAGIVDVSKHQLNFNTYSYTPPYALWNDYLMSYSWSVDLQTLNDYGSTIVEDYSLPDFESKMLFAGDVEAYWFDQENEQILAKQSAYGIRRMSDIYLVPLRDNGNGYRIARVPVRVTYWEDSRDEAKTAQVVLDNGWVLDPVGNYYALFEQIVKYQDQFDVFDVYFNQEGAISALRVVNEAKHSSYSISADQFMLSEQGENSVYTLQDTSQTAWLFNQHMQQLCDTSLLYGQPGIVRSVLHENDQLIAVEVDVNGETSVWLFDKEHGDQLDDGLLNERYFNGQLTEIIAEKAKQAGYSACPVVYEENLTVEKCAVYPYVADQAMKEPLTIMASMFTINENGNLQITLNTRRYGGVAEPLVLELD